MRKQLQRENVCEPKDRLMNKRVTRVQTRQSNGGSGLNHARDACWPDTLSLGDKINMYRADTVRRGDLVSLSNSPLRNEPRFPPFLEGLK
ncbi:MAG: hypothetical protein AMXMBFR44_3740 [Candidatus Campbellbacteria bacterium]